MKLLTKELEKKLTEQGKADPDQIVAPYKNVALVKFFDPTGSWTWYASEYNPDTKMFYGLVDGHEKEFGYFSFDELLQLRLPMGLKIERDLYFKPTSLLELYKGE